MNDEQNNQLIDIDRATTFEEALESALDVLESMLRWNKNNHLILIFYEVRCTDREFKKEVIDKNTLISFYNAVLLLHSNLILFSHFNDKDYSFSKKASSIHLKVIDQIKSLETQALKQGYSPQDKYKCKYLNIWKDLLKDIIYLCSNHSKDQKKMSNNVAQNKNSFTILGSIFNSFSTTMRKPISLPKVSIRRSQNPAIEDETFNNSTAPAFENETSPARFKVSGQNLHVAITIMILVLGLVLALLVIR